MDTYSSAISSSNLIAANASTVFDFWSKKFYCVIFYGLQKIVRLHVNVLSDEILTSDSKMKISIPKYIDQKFVVKLHELLIILNYEEPIVSKDPGDVASKALSSYTAKIVIYNVSPKVPTISIFFSVIETKTEGGKERLIGKSEDT